MHIAILCVPSHLVHCGCGDVRTIFRCAGSPHLPRPFPDNDLSILFQIWARASYSLWITYHPVGGIPVWLRPKNQLKSAPNLYAQCDRILGCSSGTACKISPKRSTKHSSTTSSSRNLSTKRAMSSHGGFPRPNPMKTPQQKRERRCFIDDMHDIARAARTCDVEMMRNILIHVGYTHHGEPRPNANFKSN